MVLQFEVELDDSSFLRGIEQDQQKRTNDKSHDSEELKSEIHGNKRCQWRESDMRPHYFGFDRPSDNEKDGGKHGKLCTKADVSRDEVVKGPGSKYGNGADQGKEIDQPDDDRHNDGHFRCDDEQSDQRHDKDQDADQELSLEESEEHAGHPRDHKVHLFSRRIGQMTVDHMFDAGKIEHE